MVTQPVMVEDPDGHLLPYSRGLMATEIMATGLGPEEAYHLAERIESELVGSGRRRVTSEELSEVAAIVLARHGGDELGRRYLAWRAARLSTRPTVVLIGGTAGVGKSTVATKLAARLGFTRVVASDAIREVLRNVLTPAVMPTVHLSSFEAHKALSVQVPSGLDPTILGFRRQAEAVAVGIAGIVDRAVTEGVSLIVEGVHVLPGIFADRMRYWEKDAAVVQVVLYVPDVEAHVAHFTGRALEGQGREPDRYLAHLPEIRKIQDYTRQLATGHGVAQVTSLSLDETIQAVLDLVVSSVTGST